MGFGVFRAYRVQGFTRFGLTAIMGLNGFAWLRRLLELIEFIEFIAVYRV